MSGKQGQIFASTEGNAWFARNKPDIELFDAETDFPLRLMRLYGLRPERVLEVGAANGYRLAEIADRYGAEVVAVESSEMAVHDGKSAFPSVNFVRADASAIPLRDSYDLVIVNATFHWIDRDKLMPTMSAIDGLLEDGGFLIIGDFLPSGPAAVGYSHLPEQQVYTYKQDYAATFVASGMYHAVCLLTGRAGSKTLTTDVTEDNRIGIWLLKKSLTGHYRESTFER